MRKHPTVLPIRDAKQKSRTRGLKSDGFLCRYCAAKCCRYLALPVETPKSWNDFESLKWLLLHERAVLFVEEGGWYLAVYNVCRHLRSDNSCGIYPLRPRICRDYSINQCEYDDTWVYEHYWETPEQVEEYAEAVLRPRRGRGFRSAKPGDQQSGRA
jgi:Fe-S-cluster containining protein